MSYESFHSRAGDYFGTCPVSGKRGYTSRKQARKARQGGAHVHGSPYKCRHCSMFHLGRMHVAETRDEYRQSQAGHVHINSAIVGYTTHKQYADHHPTGVQITIKETT